MISVSQATEMGTVYTPQELKSLAKFAHDHEMLLHVDGARIANATASLNLKLRDITRDAGVDILSFGGAKNGMSFSAGFAGTGGRVDRLGKSVAPTPAATIWRSVSRLVARNSAVSLAPASAHTDSAWVRKQ